MLPLDNSQMQNDLNTRIVTHEQAKSNIISTQLKQKEAYDRKHALNAQK